MMKRNFWEKCSKEQLIDYIMFLQDQIKMSACLAKDYRELVRRATFKHDKKEVDPNPALITIKKQEAKNGNN